MNKAFRPIILDPQDNQHRARLKELREDSEVNCYDSIRVQLQELHLCRNPSSQMDELSPSEVLEEILGSESDNYGNWIYYSWSKKLVHLLPEAEFIEVRTNRNRNKITTEEQQLLGRKTIAIAGLSVGRSAALTMATERIAGKFRLADPDILELSNMNRIKVGLDEIGLNKAISTAREISEIDPYLEIECYPEGLTYSNTESFLDGVDLFLEECDDLAMKFHSREEARRLQVPVMMEASDRCLVDIERFDLEPDRPILHGIIDEKTIRNVGSLKSFEDKLEIMSKIVDVNHISERMRLSLPEINRSIRTWPQLSSDVTYGAGVSTRLAKELLLGGIVPSGRKYFDVEWSL